jgi:hypothetical protein
VFKIEKRARFHNLKKERLPMKKSKFTEQQIAFALKQADTARVWMRCAARWGFRKRRFTTGRKSMVV